MGEVGQFHKLCITGASKSATGSEATPHRATLLRYGDSGGTEACNMLLIAIVCRTKYSFYQTIYLHPA